MQTWFLANERKGVLLQNDADKPMYVKLGAGATLSSYTAKIAPRDTQGVGGSWDLGVLRNWQGIITVIWEAGVTGSGRGTELT